jgi:hypothetical protein
LLWCAVPRGGREQRLLGQAAAASQPELLVPPEMHDSARTWARREGGRHHCRSGWACAIGLANPCGRVMCKCRTRSTSAVPSIDGLRGSGHPREAVICFCFGCLSVRVCGAVIIRKGGTDKPCLHGASSLAAGVNPDMGCMAPAWKFLPEGNSSRWSLLRRWRLCELGTARVRF